MLSLLFCSDHQILHNFMLYIKPIANYNLIPHFTDIHLAPHNMGVETSV